eukprot:753319-Hanusia_phi.AAC.2
MIASRPDMFHSSRKTFLLLTLMVGNVANVQPELAGAVFESRMYTSLDHRIQHVMQDLSAFQHMHDEDVVDIHRNDSTSCDSL